MSRWGKKKKSKPRYKKCQSCKDGVCKTCKGTNQVRIVKGRSKGATFERDVAAQVTLWTGMKFTRTPMSGGWSKTGDITPKDPAHMVIFPFNMELKNQEAWTISALMKIDDKGKFAKKIEGWWKQCTDDAKKSNRVPLLLMTKANEQVFLMLRTTEFKKLGLHREIRSSIKCGKRRIVLWEEFISVPYKEIVKRLKGK